MLPLSSKIAFALFAVITLAVGLRGFYRVYLRVKRGRPDVDLRVDRLVRRVWYAIATSLTQRRTFRERRIVSFFHSFIFYGFTFYLLVNLVDAVEGYVSFRISAGFAGAMYRLFADVLSFLVLVGVVALLIRRFALPSRRDFNFNPRTLLHPQVQRDYVTRDSLFVSGFILFHVGSRALGAGAAVALEGADAYQPFATLLSHLFTPVDARAWQVFGYWGALGSVLLFLAYFPYSKHIHIFAAPLKYFFAREVKSGVLPLVDINFENEDQKIGAEKLEDLAWPRLLDAYACIQCNRCQDVCPATVTGKSLSPAALEINKRMELNHLGALRAASLEDRSAGSAHLRSAGDGAPASFESGGASPQALLQFALTPEAAWACTTCGACMEVCPVQDEQMLDIIDIRRHQVMMEGAFPTQLQSAFRGMERNQNPWGINHEQRLAWADGLNVKTTEEKPTPDVLYWVGCAASYDPQAQKTARAFVQLLDHAGVDFAVLGKKECCTGDSARRAGNELLYRQLADRNVSTLNQVKPKLVVASCPHCLNALGSEYKQIGGDYKVMHHTQYLESLLAEGKLQPKKLPATITYHDPCYLGRHNDVYDAPRNLLKVLGNEFVELERTRNNSFCCGAGGAQFWKEEEPGGERISENRFHEVQHTLADAAGTRTLAVGCPFCKSMLGSTPSKDDGAPIVIRDIAELLLEGLAVEAASAFHGHEQAAFAGVPDAARKGPAAAAYEEPRPTEDETIAASEVLSGPKQPAPATETAIVSEAQPAVERKKWTPKGAMAKPAGALQGNALDPANAEPSQTAVDPAETVAPVVERKKWQPKAKA